MDAPCEFGGRRERASELLDLHVFSINRHPLAHAKMHDFGRNLLQRGRQHRVDLQGVIRVADAEEALHQRAGHGNGIG